MATTRSRGHQINGRRDVAAGHDSSESPSHSQPIAHTPSRPPKLHHNGAKRTDAGSERAASSAPPTSPLTPRPHPRSRIPHDPCLTKGGAALHQKLCRCSSFPLPIAYPPRALTELQLWPKIDLKEGSLPESAEQPATIAFWKSSAVSTEITSGSVTIKSARGPDRMALGPIDVVRRRRSVRSCDDRENP
jgi:hypothetical protein